MDGQLSEGEDGVGHGRPATRTPNRRVKDVTSAVLHVQIGAWPPKPSSGTSPSALKPKESTQMVKLSPSVLLSSCEGKTPQTYPGFGSDILDTQLPSWTWEELGTQKGRWLLPFVNSLFFFGEKEGGSARCLQPWNLHRLLVFFPFCSV